MRLGICNICLLFGMAWVGASLSPAWAGSNGGGVTNVEPTLVAIGPIFNLTPLDEGFLVWPVAGKYSVSSRFGYRSHPFSGKKSLHRGVDIAARRGTPILAIAPGTVKFVGYKRGFGRMVQVEHCDSWVSTYAHASATVVAIGQSVLAGQMIAKVGSTGHATGPHLHLEIHQMGRPIDPLPLLREKLIVMTP
uniref:M23 family metallopeptidase n=1 Tax=Orrella sp. TaxID=1921583 RepID=UPI0040559111